MTRFATMLISALLVSISSFASDPVSRYQKVPQELRPVDAELSQLMEKAFSLASSGQSDESLRLAESALTICERKRLVGDCAVIEASLAGDFFVEGRFDKAETLAQSALQHAREVGNEVLEADLLTTLATKPRINGNTAEALKLVTQALEYARKSKVLYVQSRVLAEYSGLKLASGDLRAAQDAIDEALDIDLRNDYDFFSASHRVYRAQVWIAQSKSNLPRAIDDLKGTYQSAIAHEFHPAAAIAIQALAHAYLQNGDPDTAIGLLRNSLNGIVVDAEGKARSVPELTRVFGLPVYKVILLSVLGDTYVAAKHHQEALQTWTELYEFAKTAGFREAEAGAALEAAHSSTALGKEDDAIKFYEISADGWRQLNYGLQLQQALAGLADLLVKRKEYSKLIPVAQEVAQLASQNKNPILRIIVLTYLAQGYAALQKPKEARSAFADAEQCLQQAYRDENVDGMKLSDHAIRLYIASANFEASQNNFLGTLLEIEHAMFAADDDRHSAAKEPFLKWARGLANGLKLRSAAEEACSSKNYREALMYYELENSLMNFEAKWGQPDSQLAKDQEVVLQKLAQLPWKLTETGAGAEELEQNLLFMGEVAGLAQRVGYDALMRYYLRHNDPKTALRFGRAALNFIDVHRAKPIQPDVQALCLYALAALGAGDSATAQQGTRDCESQAKQLDPPDVQLLNAATKLKSGVFAFTDPASAQQALESLIRQTPQAADDAAVHAQLAGTYSRQGRAKEALEQWETALTIYSTRQDRSGEAATRLEIAHFLLRSKRPEDASRILSELDTCKRLFEELANVPKLIETELAFTDLFVQTGDQRAAFQHLTSAKARAAIAANISLRAIVRAKEGAVLNDFSKDYKGALAAHVEAAALYHDAANASGEAFEWYFAGSDLKQLGRLDEAIENYSKAQRLADSGQFWAAQFWSRYGLAEAYKARGDYDLAIKLYGEQIDIAEKEQQLLNLATAHRGLGWTLMDVGEWKSALEQAELSRNAAENLGDVQQQFFALSLLMNILGDRRSSVQDVAKAFSYYEVARRLAAEHPTLDLTDLEDVIAELYWQMGRYNEGRVAADQAVRYYRKQNDKYSEVHALMARCEAETRLKDVAAAERTLEEARKLASGLPDLFTEARIYYTGAGLARAEGHLQEAVRLYDQTIQALGKLEKQSRDPQQLRRSAESYSFLFEEAIEVLYALSTTSAERSGSAVRALELSEDNKARDFLKMWGNVFARELRHSLPAELQDRERTLTQKMGELAAELESPNRPSGSKSDKQIRSELERAQQEMDALAKQLWNSHPQYASMRFPRPIAVAQVPLRPGETLLSIKITERETFVWLVEPSETRTGNVARSFYRIPQDRRWFRQRVEAIREIFNNAEPIRFRPVMAEEIFNALFPGEHALEILSAKNLIIIPDDCLFLLPFELLSPSASSSNYPLMGVPTTYFPSISALTLARSIKPERDWSSDLLAIGNPVTEDSTEAGRGGTTAAPTGLTLETELRSRGLLLEPLPGTESEITEIARLFSESKKVDVRLGQTATKSGFLHTDLSRYRFLHFATHGLLPTESSLLEPALVFSKDRTGDIFLQLSEVLNLKLSAESVVLSACNTGYGDVSKAEGVTNLGRAFLGAGASSTTVSLWKVSDESTERLMKRYYEGLLSGKSKPEALADARKVVFNEERFRNPFYWSPFVLMGD